MVVESPDEAEIGRRARPAAGLVGLVRGMLDRDPAGRWSVGTHGIWCVAQPDGYELPPQGWKLHLSATPLSIADLLRRAVPVLEAERCAFKFPGSSDTVGWLNSRSCPRGTAGKYVTVYPRDVEHFRRLTTLLDRATVGVAGPAILSDRRLRADSVVHCRFGGFTSSTALDDDGCYRPMIVGPDGALVEDRRDAWFAAPPWAPTGWPEEPVDPPDNAGHVLLNDRFVVLAAMRHSSRGGIYRAHDRQTGATVVIKQARGHVEVDPAGRDCRDQLQYEADLYSRLAPTGLVPRVIATFAEADDLFLVRELVEGPTLRRWVAAQAEVGGGAPEAGAVTVSRLLRLMETVHRAGLVLVDVSPNNIVVGPAGELRLIDPDSAAEAGRLVHPVGTPGYTPPEHRRAGPVVARPEADLFGLGCLAFLVAVGTDPILAADDPAGRSTGVRLRGWLDEIGADVPLARRLAPAISGLTDEEPARRWSAERVRRHLASSARSSSRSRTAQPDVDRLIDDGVSWLRATMTPTADRLWAAGRSAANADPCAVQHGAAGVLAALVAAAAQVAEPAPARHAVEATCRWLERRLPAEPRLLPGLYFGRSGTAWALHDAALLLDDRHRARRALELAMAVPIGSPNPDVAHGVAGAGLVQLRFWRRTGDPRFLSRARACADALVATVQRGGGHVEWPIPRTLRSVLAGQVHLGYAHGTAGIGAFLLAAGVATGDTSYLGLAVEAADTLATTVVRHGGAAYWPARPGGAGTTGAGWCAGSAGIGTFLLHAWQAVDDARFLELSLAAAVAVRRSRPRSNPSACHGLAGGGQFLLDVAAAVDEQTYHRWAEDLARLITVKATRQAGRWVVPDETGVAASADHGVGLAGVLSFLVRLRHGGPSPWTAPLTPSHAGVA